MNKTQKNPQLILLTNQIKGKIAEQIAELDYTNNGFQIIKTGIGSDFKVIKNNDVRSIDEHVEVKLGNSRLSKKQKQVRTALKRQGIQYSVYRVSNKFLEHQLCNNPRLLQSIPQSILSQFVGTFIIKDPTSCPNCNLNSMGLNSILINFGLRNMADGNVRVQSWCKNCRNYSRRLIK